MATAAKRVTQTAPRPAPKGRAETAAEKAANETTGGLVRVKKTALSLDVGPRVIHALFKTEVRKSEITEELAQINRMKGYEQLSELTSAIVKAATADHGIDLTVTFSGDTKQMEKLNDKLGIALGFREVKTATDKNGIQYEAVVVSPSVADCFPMPGETEENCPTFTRKKTFKSNFITQLKKCAMAAHAIIDQKIVTKYDAKAGTLLISGPAVKKHFGQERVLLNEKKTVGEGDAKVELSEKPSFTALANIGGASHGVAPAPGAGGAHHRGNQPGTVGGTLASAASKASTVTGKEGLDAAIITICKSLNTALDKMKEPLSKHAIASLEEVKNTIEVRLAN